jgi:hypothetical protein
MSTYDAPNQQVVRADGSGPADEGHGGSGGETATPKNKGGRPPKQAGEPEQAVTEENR